MTSIWTLRRTPADAKLTGLCGGVAQHWGIDPVLVRLGFALLALSGGIGVVLYLAGWLLIPVAGSTTAPIDDLFGPGGRRWPKEVWISLVVVVTVVVFAFFGTMSPFGMAPAVVLAIAWYFGFYKKRAQRRRAARPATPDQLAEPTPAMHHPDPTPSTDAVSWQPPLQEVPTQESTPLERQAFFAVSDPVGLYTEPEPTPPKVLRRSDSPAARRLRLVAVIVTGLALAGLGTAESFGRTVPAVAYLAAPLLVLGLTLVAATWVGRARGLLPVALLLGVVVLATASTPTPVMALRDWPATNLAYTDVARLPPGGDQLDVGHLRVDLSPLDLTAPVTYRAQVDAGQLEVIVPPDVNVVVNYRLDAGRVTMFGQKAGGTELRDTATHPTNDPARPTLTLDLGLDVGTLAVHP